MKAPWPEVIPFNILLNNVRLVEYNMYCNRVQSDCCLPLPPPEFHAETARGLITEARRLHDSLCRMLNDSKATNLERDRFNHNPDLRRLFEIVAP